MFNFSNNNIRYATLQDVTELESLLNSAYRGETAKQGWTHEANLIAGEVRVNEEMVLMNITTENSLVLKYVDDENKIIGCVNLQKLENKIYLGMFSVSPLLQGAGIGKQLLIAADEYARHLNSDCIYMTVISKRTELIDWYKRNGYVDTGKREPFNEDAITGKHLQQLEFMTLEKQLYYV
jgi:ribosomal protein S18 acetylase RimI-like enzyme